MAIIKTRFRSKNEFLQAYNEDLPHGGLFCPTTLALKEDDSVVVELHFPGLPNKVLLRGRVVWWRTALPRLRVRAGAMVAFLEEEHEKHAYVRATAQGERQNGIKRKHPRIPVEIDVAFRMSESHERNPATLRDISIGGALLVTDMHLELDDEIIIELTTPGGASPIAIAGRVTFRGSAEYGIRFAYRDGGGSQRLRELVRRLIDQYSGA